MSETINTYDLSPDETITLARIVAMALQMDDASRQTLLEAGKAIQLVRELEAMQQHDKSPTPAA
ncbi:hypothetical protein B5F36_10470 [Anaerofilum sp. An201]|nr:hypothetical protein [Anaerofilum sp. An201]OUP02645.1 hypothetical protein B5F36_10470 [Anaerofilum sp. An201]